MTATVLITGANRGVGLALARHYHAAGWAVIGVCLLYTSPSPRD